MEFQRPQRGGNNQTLDFDKSTIRVLSNLEVSRVKKKKMTSKKLSKRHRPDTINREHKNTFKPTGEGNGNPLQYSCLENPKDGGAWWATVHGVAKSQTRLSNFTFMLVILLNINRPNTPVTRNIVRLDFLNPSYVLLTTEK